MATEIRSDKIDPTIYKKLIHRKNPTPLREHLINKIWGTGQETG